MLHNAFSVQRGGGVFLLAVALFFASLTRIILILFFKWNATVIRNEADCVYSYFVYLNDYEYRAETFEKYFHRIKWFFYFF